MCSVAVLRDLQPRAGQKIREKQQTVTLFQVLAILIIYGAVDKLTINAQIN